jgi:hypothetical protein
MSTKAFARNMQSSIDKIMERHGEKLESQKLTDLGRKLSNSRLHREKEIRSLAQAERERDLESAAKRMSNIRTRPWVKDIIIQSAKVGFRLPSKRACGYQKKYESK